MANRTTADNNSDNYYVDKDTANSVTGTVPNMAADKNMTQDEICHPVEDSGADLSASDWYQLEKAIIALSKPIGETFAMELEQDPVPYASARTGTKSTTNTVDYFPAVPRYDANHDVTTTETSSDVVALFRAQVWTFGTTTSFSATLASGVLTMPSTTAGYAAVAKILEEALVNRWYSSSEDADYADSGGLYTGYRQYTVRIDGTDYPISACSVSANTLTLSAYPDDGTYDVEFHPYAVYNYTDRFRLRKICGEALVSMGDDTEEHVIGGHRMDRLQGHLHSVGNDNELRKLAGYTTGDNRIMLREGGDGSSSVWYTDGPYTDATNGTPRTGKTTDVRSHSVAVYTWIRVLTATTWTSN